MKIVPHSDPSDATDPHKPGADVVSGVNEERGGHHPTTTSNPRAKLSSMPLKHILGQITDIITAIKSQPSADVKVFAENEDTSKVIAELTALLKNSHNENEDEGEGEGADAGGVGSRVMADRDEAPRGIPRMTTMKVKLDTDGEVLAEYINSLCTTTSVPSALPACGVGLRELTKGDLSIISSGMMYLLRQEASEEDAIERFLETYPSMKQLNEDLRGFSVMHLNALDRLIADQQKFAKVRLFLAAALSIGDMFTDILMIVQYFQTGESGYAWASLGSLLTNLTLQASVSYTQNRAKPWKRQVREQFYVWSLVKPGVDAWRVASGSAHEKGQMMNAKFELSFNKGCELVAESIPGAMIQLSAIMTSDSTPTTNALFSFAFCIFTAAFTSTIMSWDWDLNKENRKSAPWYYGYIPSNVNGKIRVFISLFSLSSFNILTRSFACVLFYIEGGFSMVAKLLGAELLTYFVVKGLRRDLWYWLPVYGAGGVFVSWLLRWIVKVIVDWTAVVQFRHPIEVGGAYFTFSLGLTVVMGIVAALQYEREKAGTGVMYNVTVIEDMEGVGADETGGEERGFEESTVVISMIIACVGMVVSYVTLLTSVKKEYLHTFVSTKTSNEQTQDQFTKNEEDEERFNIFNDNRHKWEYKIGSDVKAWINERLPVWLEEEPEWFTDQRRSIIPDEFVTDPGILVRLRTNNVKAIIDQRRRSSIGLIFAPEGGGGEEEQEDRDDV